MATDLRCRPSSLLGVTDSWVAFCTDRAVWTFASAIRKDMDEAESRLPKNAKDAAHTRARQRVLDEYLGIELSETPDRFRSVGGMKNG
jgi:hypothetical protein